MGSLEQAFLTGFICRICSKMKKVVIHAYGEEGRRINLAKHLQAFLGVDVNTNDDLPKTVCLSCIIKLKKYYEWMELMFKIHKLDLEFKIAVNNLKLVAEMWSRLGAIRKVGQCLLLATIFLTGLLVLLTPQQITPLPKQVDGWEVNVSRETRLYIVPENETSVISGREVCTAGGGVGSGGSQSRAPSSSSQPPHQLLILIHSAPENSAQRAAIRDTWGRSFLNTTASVRTAFLLGWARNTSTQLAVEEESIIYQDVIQEDFIDSYNNLTVKSVMMLKWFLRNCPASQFLMKTDDDMFINVNNLLKILSKIRRTQILIGTLICRAKPILDSQSKWYTPKYIYPKAFYPNYLSGTAYLMSRDVASRLYTAALSTPLIHLEDVYITGMCASKAGLKPRNHPAFSYQHLGLGCDPGLVTNHRLSPSQLRQVWRGRDNCSLTHSKPTSSSSTPRLKAVRNQCH